MRHIILFVALAAVVGCGEGSSVGTSSSLVWSDFYSQSPVSESSSIGEDVAACDGSTFVVGASGWNFVLRAYSSEDGALRWQDFRPLENGGVSRLVACDGGRVYVAVEEYSPAHVAFLRTYDGASGAVLWELEVDRGEWNRALQVSADGRDVFLLTGSGDADEAAIDLWALDGESGTVRWRTNSVSADADSIYTRLTVTEYQACTLRVPGSPPALQCYDRTSGDRVWYAADIGDPGVADSPQREIASRLAAFARGDDLFGVVAAYDPRDGELLWSRVDFDAIADVHVEGDRVLVTGTDFEIDNPEDWRETLIFRATGIDTDGHTVWEHRYEHESVRSSVLVSGRLLVAGDEWQVRIYDPRNGELLAEQPAEEVPRSRWMWDIAAEGDRYAMVGATFAETSHRRLDFAVRGYEVETGR